MDQKQLYGIIEEYKTLREECLKIFEQRTIPLVYMSLIIVTLITAAIEFEEDFVFALVLTSIFPVAVHWIGKRYAVARISYYIKTHIEPKIDGLNWETWIWESRGNKLDDFEEWIVCKGVIYFYILIGLVCAYYYTCNDCSDLSVFMLSYNIILAIVLVILLSGSTGGKWVKKSQRLEKGKTNKDPKTA